MTDLNKLGMMLENFSVKYMKVKIFKFQIDPSSVSVVRHLGFLKLILKLIHRYRLRTDSASMCQTSWRLVISLQRYRDFSRMVFFLVKCKNSLDGHAKYGTILPNLEIIR